MNTNTALTALGVSPWIPLDYLQNPFSVALQIGLSAAASLTYQVEHTLDSLATKKQIKSISRAGTTVTVVFYENHTLRTGDSINVENSGITGADGSWDVTLVDPTTVTYTTVVSGAATGGQQNGSPLAILMHVFPHATLVTKTATDQGNYQFPVTACRLKTTVYASGEARLFVNQGLPY